MKISLSDGKEWLCPHVTEKLRARARLPGAFAFDRASVALANARERNVATADLLPLACASSWFVNNAAPSTLYRRWLVPPCNDVWSELVLMLSAAPYEWSRLTDEDRTALGAAFAALAADGHGAGAISKVLALLVPSAVPLMPDAALWFALGSVARPTAADAQTAGADQIVPMMNWFTRESMQASTDLETFADAVEGMTLSPAQVLDRVVWFDSVGYRHFRNKAGAGWFAVADGDRRAVVPVAVPFEGDVTREPIDLRAETTPVAFRDDALRSLDADAHASS